MSGLLGVLAPGPLGPEGEAALRRRVAAFGRCERLCDPRGRCWGLVASADEPATPGGGPPSHRGRWTVATAGGLTNLISLRKELAGRLGEPPDAPAAALAAWVMEDLGAARALDRLEGEVVVAAWDGVAGHLHLSRDRMGAWSLFVGPLPGGGALVFGTSVRALLRAFPALQTAGDAVLRSLDPDGPQAPASPLRGLSRLGPGTRLALAPGRPVPPSAERWWTPPETPLDASGDPGTWARSLAMALHLAAMRRVGPGTAALVGEGPGVEALQEVLAERQPFTAVAPPAAEPGPADLARLGAALDEPAAAPELLPLFRALERAAAAGNALAFSGIGVDELYGLTLPRLRRRDRLLRADAATPVLARALAQARWLQLPERRIAPAAALARALGVSLRAPLASAELLALGARVPLPLLRARGTDDDLLAWALGHPPAPLPRAAPPDLAHPRWSAPISTLAERLEGWLPAGEVALARASRERTWGLLVVAAWRDSLEVRSTPTPPQIG